MTSTTLLNVFDTLTADELAEDRATVAAAGLDAARRRATERLLEGPGAGLGPAADVNKLLVDRERFTPAWERLEPFEIRWSLLVLRLVDGPINQLAAIRDARHRGATWAAVGQVLGITASTAHTRFSKQMPAAD